MIGRQTISEAARLVAMQVVARSVGDSAHLGFLGAAGCSLGAFLLALTLKESLPPAKHKKIRSLRAVNPFSFVGFFRQSKGLAGMGALLACWQLVGRRDERRFCGQKRAWPPHRETDEQHTVLICGYLVPWVNMGSC